MSLYALYSVYGTYRRPTHMFIIKALVSKLSSIFTRAEKDVFAEFDRVKRAHTIAASDVVRARAALAASIRRATELAESARTAAETAANKATANAARLALEARAAAESLEFHRAQAQELNSDTSSTSLEASVETTVDTYSK